MFPVAAEQMTSQEPAANRRRNSTVLSWPPLQKTSLPPFVTVVAVVAILYLARDVFLPIAIALLLTFALAPLVKILRQARVPRPLAVIATVLMASSLLGAVGLVVALQLGDLARNVPLYQTNIVEKVRTLKEAGASGGLIDRLSGVIERVGKEIQREEVAQGAGPQQPAVQAPLPVEVVTPQHPLETLGNMAGLFLGPLATTGLIIVIVIFMLLEREDLRDRFIRLVGHGDLHRTTEALEDAGRRVGQYLLMQLVVNVTYAIPITLGLWVIGVPNAVLWGALTMVLRFIPYIGPVLGMLMPLVLALAVSPGWDLVVWTALLFLTVELISNNVVEPWLYGSRTGLSPLSIVVAAVFWTWLWGPLGLVLSTPLTVCLSVLGRHVPQFEFLDVLFGSEPVLEPEARLYQRLLAGDPNEATDQAEEILEEKTIAAFYGEVGIPALVLAAEDRSRGVMSEEQKSRVTESARSMLANLLPLALDVAAAEKSAPADETEAEQGDAAVRPDFTGRRIVCIGGRSELDDVAAEMLAQIFSVGGADAAMLGYAEVRLTKGVSTQARPDGILVNYVDPNPQRHARLLIRRLRRAFPGCRIGFVFWAPGQEKRQESTGGEMGEDFLALSLDEALTSAVGVAEEPRVQKADGVKLFESSVQKPFAKNRVDAAALPLRG
jgi:predicted PurR-regulated permease PerM